MFASIEAKIIAGLLAVVLIGGAIGYIYNKGESAGSADVRAKVNATTVNTINDARTGKEKANETVRNAPIDRVIDGLR